MNSRDLTTTAERYTRFLSKQVRSQDATVIAHVVDSLIAGAIAFVGALTFYLIVQIAVAIVVWIA